MFKKGFWDQPLGLIILKKRFVGSTTKVILSELKKKWRANRLSHGTVIENNRQSYWTWLSPRNSHPLASVRLAVSIKSIYKSPHSQLRKTGMWDYEDCDTYVTSRVRIYFIIICRELVFASPEFWVSNVELPTNQVLECHSHICQDRLTRSSSIPNCPVCVEL